MAKINFYTHEEEDVENGIIILRKVYIDTETHEMFININNKWLSDRNDFREFLKILFGDRYVTRQGLNSWKEIKINLYNNSIKWKFKETDQNHEENLWK